MTFRLTAELTEAQIARLGGKGRGLWQLLNAGARIPPTVCIPPGEDCPPLEEGFYAVRSSAAAEDGADRSYAGQFETLLRVPREQVAEAVDRCRASADSERARAYGDGGELSVLIQPMIEAERAGVLFTCDPVSGSRDRILVEWTAGTAEELVGGTVDGQRAWFERGDSEPLVREALLLEERLGHGPLDFEWAQVEGQTVWLQVRPVTSGVPGSVHYLASGEQPPVARDEVHWTSVNAREALPNVLTPLMQELLLAMSRDAFLASLQLLGASISGREVMGLFYGRVFLSVTALEAIVGELPVANPRSLLEGILIGEHREKPRLRFSLAMVPNLLRLLHGAIMFRSRYRALERSVYEPQSLEGLSNRALWQKVRRGMDLRAGFHLHVLGSAGALSALTQLEELAGSRALAARLLQGLGTFRFASAAAALRDVVVDPNLLEPYLEEYGHLGQGSIDLNEKTWRDDPSQVLGMVEQLRAAGETGGRAAYLERLGRLRREAEREFFARLPWYRKPLAWLVLRMARVLAPHRENTKFLLHRRLDHVRACLRLLERRLGVELTFLEPSEIEGLLDGVPVDPALIEERKRTCWRDQARPCPLHRVEGPRGTRLYYPQPPSGSVLKGVAASPGLARGRARVLLSLGEASRLEPGDVLITSTTDPCWTPLFSIAGAVVVEVGGLLSHGAVVAREVGIPAVLGVNGLMAVIRDGEELEVDGSSGCVYRISESR